MISLDGHGWRYWPNLSPLGGLNLIIWPLSWGSRPRLFSFAPTGLVRIGDWWASGPFMEVEDLNLNRSKNSL